VPQTIADAISLVRLLEERYLWVDALCIVQDDEETKHDQITNMASIFTNATVTIIAKQGKDVNYGLRGLRGISHPRDFPQNIFEIEPGFSISQCRDMQNYGTPQWSKRGWTYQEELFSKRKLIFFYDSIQWKCGCSSFSEDLVTDNLLRRFLFNANGQMVVLSNHFPDFNGYERLVNEYNSRKLTHPEDAVCTIFLF
jgi:hypothetical protein